MLTRKLVQHNAKGLTAFIAYVCMAQLCCPAFRSHLPFLLDQPGRSYCFAVQQKQLYCTVNTLSKHVTPVCDVS